MPFYQEAKRAAEEMRRDERKFENRVTAASIVILAFAVCVFIWLFVEAIEKEARFNDNIRRERCASFGENISSTMKGYCEDLGV